MNKTNLPTHLCKRLERMYFNSGDNVNNFLKKCFFVCAVVFFIGYNSVYLVSIKNYGVSDLAVFYVAGASIINRIDLAPSELYEKTKIKTATFSLFLLFIVALTAHTKWSQKFLQIYSDTQQ